MISDKRNEILSELESIEDEFCVEIIYACESGSRAWGFESQDSDFDVRFIYVHRTEWYLSIECNRDVIERPISGELDICGWDLRKSLGLIKKSNPPLLEWLNSPIIYIDKRIASQHIKKLAKEYYSPQACFYHYLHMAKGNYRHYLQGEQIWLKKYLYVLRPVLACNWIEQKLGLVPTEFHRLVAKIIESPEVLKAINALLARKKAGVELDWGDRIPAISDYLDSELERLNSSVFNKAPRQGSLPLDIAFRKILTTINGSRI